MPLVEYETETGERIEELFRAGEEIPAELESSRGRIARRVEVSAVARTASRWGDTPGSGRRFDRGLGCWVESDKHAAEIAKSQGCVSLREFGDETEIRNAFERGRSARAAKKGAELQEQAEYRSNLQRLGSAEAAVTETWSARRILSGDTVYAK